MTSPKVSVIVPAYNAEKYLERCLNSIAVQTMQDFEVIVVDDGSQDMTAAIAKQFSVKDKRFKLVQKQNGGVSSARNKGLGLACGSWICFVDADDYISNDYLPSDINQEVDMYIQNWKYHGEEEFKEYLEPNTYIGEGYNDFLRQFAHFDLFRGVLCKIIKKSIVDSAGIRFIQDVRIGEDTLFFMDYASRCRGVCVLNDGCYFYDRRAEEWTSKYNLSREEVLQFFSYFMEKYDNLPVPLPHLAEFELVLFSGFVSKENRSLFNWQLTKPVLSIKKALIPIKGPGYLLKYMAEKTFSFFI